METPRYKPCCSAIVMTPGTFSKSSQGYYPQPNCQQSDPPIEKSRKDPSPFYTVIRYFVRRIAYYASFFYHTSWCIHSAHPQATVHHYSLHCSALLCTSKRILLIFLIREATGEWDLTSIPVFMLFVYWPLSCPVVGLPWLASFLSPVHNSFSQTTKRIRCIN